MVAPRQPPPLAEEDGDGIFDIAGGKFSSPQRGEPGWQWVPFTSLLGAKATTVRDPIVLVMNTSDRMPAATPFLSFLPKLPDLDALFPDINQVLLDFKGMMEESIGDSLSALNLADILENAAEAALEAMPEIDAEALGENMRDLIALLLPDIDFPTSDELRSQFAGIVQGILDSVDFEDIIPEFKEDLLVLLDKLMDEMPTIEEITEQLRGALTGKKDGSFVDMLEDLLDAKLLSKLPEFLDDKSWLDDMFRNAMKTRLPQRFTNTGVTGQPKPQDTRKGISLVAPHNIKRKIFYEFYYNTSELMQEFGEFIYDALHPGGKWYNRLTGFVAGIGDTLDGLIDKVAEQVGGQLRLMKVVTYSTFTLDYPNQTILDTVLMRKDRATPVRSFPNVYTSMVTIVEKPYKNIAYMIEQLVDDLGDKLDGLLNITIIPLIAATAGNIGHYIGEMLNTQFNRLFSTSGPANVLEDLAEEIGKAVGNLWNSLVTGEGLRGSFASLGKKIGEALAGPLENHLLPHIQDAILGVVDHFSAEIKRLWEDLIDPRFKDISAMFDDLQDDIDNLGTRLIEYIKDKLFKPIVAPIRRVSDQGFEVWTKGVGKDGKPAEGRYIAFSGSLDLPGMGFLAALREKLVWPEFVGELREKFAYEDSVIR